MQPPNYEMLKQKQNQWASAKYTKPQIEQMTFAYLEGIDLESNVAGLIRYSSDKIEQILKAMIHGLDAAVLMNPLFSCAKMNELRRFMEDCNSFNYTRLCRMSAREIYQIRRFVKYGLKFERYLGLDWQSLDLCLRVIRLGYEELLWINGTILRIEHLYTLYFGLKGVCND